MKPTHRPTRFLWIGLFLAVVVAFTACTRDAAVPTPPAPAPAPSSTATPAATQATIAQAPPPVTATSPATAPPPATPATPSPAIVYRWNAANWLTSYNQGQFSAVPFTNPDGTIGADVSVTPRDANNPYNHIVVSAAGLKGGQQYTAMITFSVLQPTTYPSSFYMFARHSAGNQYDVWRTWIGLPGATRTIALPLDLKAIEAGTWKLYMGISKTGALRIHSIVVYSGIVSDVARPFVAVLPTPAGTPVSHLPPGVSQATGFTPFTPAGPATPTTTLSMDAYHLTPDAPNAPASVAAANAAALQQALNDCKTHGATRLIFLPGTYRIASKHNITLDALEDVTIDGQHARLVFENLTNDGQAFFLSKCSRLSLQNLTLDWDQNQIPIASLAQVSNLSADKLQCDFAFPDLDAAQTAITRVTRWRGIFPMDPEHLVANDKYIFAVPRETSIQPGSAPNVLRVTFPAPVPFINGNSYCIRHLYYDMTAFKVSECRDLTFSEVDINSMPGMGWYFTGAMHNFQLSHCHILRAPGSRIPLTTAADGIHVGQFVDNLKIDQCGITGTGDDAMNIHCNYYQGTIVLDPADPMKITLLNCPAYQLRLAPGDPVEFFDGDFAHLNHGSAPVSRQVATVVSENHGSPQTVIRFTSPIPPGVTPLSILSNGKFAARNVCIKRCAIEYTNGRGILFSAHDALIEDCSIRGTHCSAINLEADIVQPLWAEGRGDSNLLIRNNVFENNNDVQRYGGAVIYTDAHIPWGPTTAPLYQQITIEKNHFINCPGPAMALTCCSNLLVRNNQIHMPQPPSNPMRNAGMIVVANSSDAALGGNTWAMESPAASAGGVLYDPASTTHVDVGVNVSINAPHR